LLINVLIVEDDPMVIKFNKFYLEQVQGFEIKAFAQSGEEALELIKQQKFDLILLDIYMPGITGLELLSQIRKMDKSIDVIVISAARDSLNIKKALQYGVVDYLIKPFEFERFKNALTSYIEREMIIKKQCDLSQEELDKHFLSSEQSNTINEVPKGLDKNTLKSIWHKILEINGDAFSTKKIAELSGISRVSMRKYLIFLEEIGVVKKEIIYGSMGRPIYKFRVIKQCIDFINDFL